MMYVKHVPAEGHENIYEATSVTNITQEAARRERQDGTEPTEQDFGFFLTTPDGRHLQFSGGEVFVMNEAGATIDRYLLAGTGGAVNEVRPVRAA